MTIRGFNTYLPQERVSPQNPLRNQERPRQDKAVTGDVVIFGRPGNVFEITAEVGSSISDWTMQDADSPLENDIPPAGIMWPVCEAGSLFLFAGSGVVRIKEWSYEMSIIRSNMLSGAGGGNTPASAATFVANPVTAASSDGEVIPNSASNVTSRIIYDPADTSNLVVWVADTLLKATAFTGLPLLAGGFYDLPGKQYVAVNGGVVNVYSGRFV